MIIKRRKYAELIEACAFVSFICLLMVSASLITQEWTYSTASVVGNFEGVEDSTVSHGLLKGTLIRRLLASAKSYDIHLTCILSENVCTWSCLEDADSRQAELEALLRGEKPEFSCAPVSSRGLLSGLSLREANDSTGVPQNGTNTGEFLNAGMFYSTLSAVILTLVVLIILFILSAVNCIMCPADPTFNTPGMIIVSNVAFVANMIGVILYGCNYDYWLMDNIGILDTIVGEYQSDASLGYSYWIFMCSSLLIPLVVVFIAIRDGLLRKDRAETVIIVAQVNDPTTVLY